MAITRLFRSDPRKKTSLILHIGMPKTGTTAIQEFLAYNRGQLLKQKILYPECGIPVNQHTALVKSIALQHFDWAHFNKVIDQFDPEKYVIDVLRNCQGSRCNKVIISSEFFWASPSMQAGPAYHIPNAKNYEYIRKLIKSCHEIFSIFDKIQIVVYLRRQDEWLDSFFNQQLKDGFPIPSADELINEVKNYLLYNDNLSIWAEYFSKEDLIVRNYDNLPDADVVNDFIKIAGIKSGHLNKPEKTTELVNAKLSRKSAAIMRQAINKNLSSENLTLLRQVLQGFSSVQSYRKKIKEYTVFEPEFYSSILDLYNDDNKKLSENFVDLNITSKLESSPNSGYKDQKTDNDTEKLIEILLSKIEKSRVDKISRE